MGREKVADAHLHSRGAFRPSLAHATPFRKQRAKGRPGGRMHPGLAHRRIARARKTTGTGGDHTGLPCAMVYGLYVLFGEPFRLPPSPAQSLSAFSFAWT